MTNTLLELNELFHKFNVEREAQQNDWLNGPIVILCCGRLTRDHTVESTNS